MIEKYFLPFLATYIKEMKAESIPILVHPELQELLDSFNLPRAGTAITSPIDYSKMTTD